MVVNKIYWIRSWIMNEMEGETEEKVVICCVNGAVTNGGGGKTDTHLHGSGGGYRRQNF